VSLRHLRVEHRDVWEECLFQEASAGARSAKKKFSTKTCHNLGIRWLVANGFDRDMSLHAIQQRLYIHCYIFTIIDVLSKYAWAVPFKNKSGNDVATVIAKIIWDDERCPKNLQTDRGMEFYNTNMQKLEETWCQYLFDVFRNESIGRRTIQPYVEERHVETVYAQTIDWLTYYCVSCQSTTRESIGQSTWDLSMYPQQSLKSF